MGTTAAALASPNYWDTLPSEIRAMVRKELGIRTRARLSLTCKLNRREDRPQMPHWIAFGDKWQRMAMKRAIAELAEVGLLETVGRGRLFATPGEPEIRVSNGDTLLSIASRMTDSTKIALTATPRYRAAGWKWLTDAVDPVPRFKTQLGVDGAVPYVLDHIDWEFTCDVGNNPSAYGPFSSLRKFVDDMHPWRPVAHYFTFSAADANDYMRRINDTRRYRKR